MLSRLSVETLLATDPSQAEFLIQRNHYRVNAFICEIQTEADASAKSIIWRRIRAKTKQRGYYITQKCFLIVGQGMDEYAHYFGGSDLEIIHLSKIAEFDKLVDFCEKLRARPILRFQHCGASPFTAECVHGERIDPITLQMSYDAEPVTVQLFRSTRAFIDAVAKYSSKSQQKDNESMVALMAADPFYASLLSERSFTVRNFITSWNRFVTALTAVAGQGAAGIAATTKAGREAFYYIDAECQLKHTENALQ
jgi:hypothetical protein